MNIYIFEARGLKNISIQLGILVLLCTLKVFLTRERVKNTCFIHAFF